MLRRNVALVGPVYENKTCYIHTFGTPSSIIIWTVQTAFNTQTFPMKKYCTTTTQHTIKMNIIIVCAYF